MDSFLTFFPISLPCSQQQQQRVHTAEMLPTPIRNSAHAAADALAGIGGACSPFLVSPNNSMMLIGIVMGSITMISATLVWMLPETRGITLGTAISRASSPALSPQQSLDGSNGSRRRVVQASSANVSLDGSQRQQPRETTDGDDDFSRLSSNIEVASDGIISTENLVVAFESTTDKHTVIENLDDNDDDDDSRADRKLL